MTHGQDEIYTIGLLTCHWLPGNQACEYSVDSESPLLSSVDLVILSIAFLLCWYASLILGFIILCIWYLLKRASVRKESILAIRDVGIQIKTVYWNGSTFSRFIDRLKVEDIVINEGISFWQIKSYLAILIKDQEDMVVVFEVRIRQH
ncbi:Phosphatidylinositol N-acetylglucosaminyltransferase subunit H [Choanephora cucurbitarum]|uniref:Phosphatidylinositol N-acetylglucosaminyltransferase subunit H n=1 Tax=Choanephora cucurbitarum TaxID=101091 RepID=A0A1C7MZF9_9FUNG|nr:Phosphatidylinositol N-acetylglucosaminyltransferase subunit H [Choanephora cucurbitarum]